MSLNFDIMEHIGREVINIRETEKNKKKFDEVVNILRRASAARAAIMEVTGHDAADNGGVLIGMLLHPPKYQPRKKTPLNNKLLA